MKFLLDENVPLSMKKVIQQLGYNVLTLNDLNKLGIKNGEVAEIAIKEGAIIITFDSDFLRIKKSLQNSSRIIYMKVHQRNRKLIQELIEKNLKDCIVKLAKPGKVIITEIDCIFETP